MKNRTTTFSDIKKSFFFFAARQQINKRINTWLSDLHDSGKSYEQSMNGRFPGLQINNI